MAEFEGFGLRSSSENMRQSADVSEARSVKGSYPRTQSFAAEDPQVLGDSHDSMEIDDDEHPKPSSLPSISSASPTSTCTQLQSPPRFPLGSSPRDYAKDKALMVYSLSSSDGAVAEPKVQASVATPSSTESCGRQCSACKEWKSRGSWNKKQWSKKGRCKACTMAKQIPATQERSNGGMIALTKRKGEASAQERYERPVQREEGLSAVSPAGFGGSEGALSPPLPQSLIGWRGANTCHDALPAQLQELVDEQVPTTPKRKRGRDEEAATGAEAELMTAQNAADLTGVIGHAPHTSSTSVIGGPGLAQHPRDAGQTSRDSVEFGDGVHARSGAVPIPKRTRPNCSEAQEQASPMIATRGRYRIVHHASFGEQGRFSIGTSGVLSTTAKAPQRAGKGPTGATPSTAHSARKSKAQEATMARSGSGMSSLGANSSSQANHMSSPETSSAGATIPLVLQAVGPGDPDGSPLVVIDGSNVAFAYREDISRPEWSPQGILLALEYFERRGVAAVAFVPRPRVDGMHPSNEHRRPLLDAVKSGAVSTVPTKANDDLFILSYAIQRSGHIVTNDQFRDHTRSPSTLASLGLTKDTLQAYLRRHHVCYTFARGEFVPNPEATIIKMITGLAPARVHNSYANVLSAALGKRPGQDASVAATTAPV